MKTICEHEIEFEIVCNPEDIDFVGNCSAIDDKTDKTNEQWIRDQLESGNEWAWCMVTVTGRWNGLETSDHLGGCSYLSREDFENNSGYCDDMKQTVVDQINEQAEKILTAVA